MNENYFVFVLNHPAHYHLFKNIINYFLKNDINIKLYAREKDILLDLLEQEGLQYTIIKTNIPNILSWNIYLKNIYHVIYRDIFLFKNIKNRKKTIGIGTDTAITHILKNSYFFGEDDDDTTFLGALITYPFAKKIIIPNIIRYKYWKTKRIKHDSYHELAYLHPDNFSPDKEILKKYNLKEKKYIVVRFSALNAYHDVKAKGISKILYKKIKEVTSNYILIESIENSQTHTIDLWDMHHVMAFSKMIISDSQTMTVEASVLGIPSIRINNLKSSVIKELGEGKYNLNFSFNPDDKKNIINMIKYLLYDSKLEDKWEEKRNRMLNDKIDLNQWMIEYFEKEINN